MSDSRRIAWLSPYGPRSDIGAFTRCLLPHFVESDGAPRFDCDLFVNACGPTYSSPVPSMDIPWGVNIGEILSRYDAAFFNLGNNVQNHREITEALRRFPGIAIIHDFTCHHFFAHRCFEELKSPAGYARLMHDYYGSAGFNMALRSGIITRDATIYAPWDRENVGEYPLMEPLVSLAAAAVVHSRFMEEHVARFFKGPILRAYLPSDQKMAPSDEDLARWRCETARKERCQLTTFGHIGRPKCIDTIIQAIAQSPILRARAHLVIAGHPGDLDFLREIETMVVKLGLTKQVTFEYSVTDERLLEIKNETDIFLNLRFPNTEGASGSLVEMMNTARPIIAYRSGCYAEIPEDAAVLIDRAQGISAVIDAVEELISNPDRRIEIGAKARDQVRNRNSENYVRQLKKFTIDIGSQLRGRSRLIVPVRDALSWKAEDVATDDTDWFNEMTRARRSFLLLERGGDGHSPEIFLTWPMDDVVAFAARVLLFSSSPGVLTALLADLFHRIGRWQFARLVSTVGFFQKFCEKQDTSEENIGENAERIADVRFWQIAIQLQPSIFVRLLYFCVLGRTWIVTDIDRWAKQIRHGANPCAILLEFLASKEYRETFPDHLMAEVEDWARREIATSTKGRSETRRQIAWPVESDVRFNEDSPATEALLGQAWHKRGQQGRWSDGRAGGLRFLLPEDTAREGARLMLRVRVAGTRVTGPRTVVAQHNQLVLGSITFGNDDPHDWDIELPASVCTKEGVDLMLVANQDYSPAASGESADKRSLGIMLISGRLAVGARRAVV